MKKRLLYIFGIILFSNITFAQNKMWQQASEERLVYLEKMERISFPTTFKLFSLNLNEFKQAIATAPIDLSGKYSNTIVGFPDATGTISQFRVYESPIMEAELAAKYPGIKSYTAVGIDDPTARLRFSVTLFGLHSMSLSGNTGTYYIDTYTKDLNNYIVYNRNDIQTTRTFGCLVEDDHEQVKQDILQGRSTFASDGLFRQYRLAMACTIEYAAYHVNAAGLNAGTEAQKKAAVLAAMNVTMTRVNGVFERDMSLRMNLVANNDLVIFITSDNFTNNDANILINESQVEIDAAIGFSNYDIGHTVSTGGGGLAFVQSPCGSIKAKGITGSGAPVGDPFDIDYVAHEIGHQWGARHTQNNNCNRSASTAVEPGSGSTIMAYAGICPPNVQNNSDAHFHAVSIAQMAAFVAGSGNSCASSTASGNFAPVVNAGPDYIIPKGTAFILKGAATDANNDALTYCWEQTDIEVSTQPPLQTSNSGPNFRSRPPVSSPDRYMPRIQDVIANNLAPTWEVVPNVARTMNFALTVRDNRTPNGGQTGRDNTVITTANVGPFLVNSPNTNVSWIAGSNQTVTWTVAGTNSNGINASFVDILLSTDGGTTYTRVLASKVPNDGSEIVTIPNTVGTTNRIMVRGHNHIFYDISNTNFTITTAPSSFSVAFSGVEGTQYTEACLATSTNYTINYTALGGFSSSTSFAASGNPAGSTVTFSPTTISATGTVTLTVGNLTAVAAGDYQIIVNATSGGTTKQVPFYLSVGISPVVLTSPANNAINQGTTTILTWNPNPVATSYDVQVASDNAFTNIVSSGNVTTNSYTVPGLNQGTSYYWRVLPKNITCSGVYGTSFKFTTGTISCATTASTNVPIAISTVAASTITSTINIPTGGTISDVNITMNIAHTWISDLTATLTSPTGTVVQLFSNRCGSANNLVATFDDSGVAIVCGSNPAISGVVLPSQALSAFNGSNSTGTWTLTISDNFSVDGGALNSWSLNICSVQPMPEINIAKDLSSSDIPSGAAANSSYNTIFAPTTLGNNLVNTYYIENEGNANLTIGSVSITGANPGDFSVSTIPAIIPVGATLNSAVAFTVTFTPQAAGVRTATISIVNNDSNENPYTFDVEGTGGNCATSTTWDGTTWSNGAPSSSKKVFINENYITAVNGNFECCSLEISATKTLTISSSDFLTIDNSIINNGNIIVENSGSIVQINETDTNSGVYTGTKFQVNRIAQATNLDYIYWSSPVENFAVSNLPNSNRFQWNPTVINSNNTQGNWAAASGSMVKGKGYIARASNGASTPANLAVLFQDGKPNNGTLTTQIQRGTYTGLDYDAEPSNPNNVLTTKWDDNWNLVGNPYPSAINALSFLTANTNIEGFVNIWTHQSMPSSIVDPFYQNFAYNYTANDYISYNGTGTVSGPTGFAGNIASGQGFFVLMSDGAASSSTITFTNAMRRDAVNDLNYDNSQFYRNSNPLVTTTETIEKNRIWLDIVSANGNASRTLIGYLTNATNDKDRLFDVVTQYSNQLKIYSYLNTTDDQEFLIQGRSLPFDVNDQVKIGVSIPSNGNYSIAIAALDGLFNQNQDVYIQDNLLNTIHNIKLAPYNFSSNEGNFTDRFVLRYNNTALNDQIFDNTIDLVITTNEMVTLHASKNIRLVEVFDVLGRKIYEKNSIQSTEVILDKLKIATEVLLVRTTFDDGSVITKKIIYQ